MTPWKFPQYFKTIDNSHVPYWYLKERNLPWYKKPGIHISKDRTFILEGGPDVSKVNITFTGNNTLDKLIIDDDNLGLGSIKMREIPFEESHKYFYIANEIKITHFVNTKPDSTTTSTTETTTNLMEV